MNLVRNYYQKLVTFCLILLFALSFNVYSLETNPLPQRITILHTNDHHGHFWSDKRGQYGLAAQKTQIDQIRAEVKQQGGTVLLLSGGDINTGVPESDLLNAEPDFIGMSAVGYDAMVVGNHEFDNALPVLRQQQQWANFPFLSANIYDKSTEQRLFKPYQIFQQNGLNIAVIGVTTEDTLRLGSKKILANIDFHSPTAELKILIPQLKQQQQIDLIIVLSHLGYYPDGQSGTSAPGDVELARALPVDYVDLIVGGHSHSTICMATANQLQPDYSPGTTCQPDYQNGTWILQANEWGKYVGRADFSYSNGKLELTNYQLLPVNLKYSTKEADGSTSYHYYAEPISPDADVLALLKPYQEQGTERLGITVGHTNVPLQGERNIVRYQQTNLGKLLIQAQMAKTQADFGFISSGSIRASIEPGDITYRDILTVQPFGNSVGYAEMNGHELLPYLTVIANKTPGSGAYPQFDNIHFELVNGELTDVTIAGNPLKSDKIYRFSLPSYNANGGDGYPNIMDRFMNTGVLDAEVLRAYLMEHSPIQ